MYNLGYSTGRRS